MDQKKMGKTISFLRKQSNMTQHQLADWLGVSDKTISKWENGHGAPDISILTKLSIILDIDIESLLEGNLTHYDFKWKGILLLNYPENIRPYMMMWTLPIVEFQLSLLLLTGICHITIIGSERDILFTQDILDVDGFSIQIEYECRDLNDREAVDDIIGRINAIFGVMVIFGFDFIYGKDLTKLFKRVIYDSKKPVTVENHRHLPLSIRLYPAKTYDKSLGEQDKDAFDKLILERGIIAFYVEDQEDLWDSANLIYLIERHIGEKIGCLKDIATRRGYVTKKNVSE